MDLLTFWRDMNMDDRKVFAKACGSSFLHVRNVAYKQKPCSPELAISIERESGGVVRCETTCPQGADWAYIRSSGESDSAGQAIK